MLLESYFCSLEMLQNIILIILKGKHWCCKLCLCICRHLLQFLLQTCHRVGILNLRIVWEVFLYVFFPICKQWFLMLYNQLSMLRWVFDRKILIERPNASRSNFRFVNDPVQQFDNHLALLYIYEGVICNI